MTLIEATSGDREQRPARDTPAEIGKYKEALERVMALAPALRAERTALEALAPVDGPHPSAIRRRAWAVVLIVAAAGAPLFAAAASPSVVALGAAFGLAAAAAGDRLGAALRRLTAPAPWRQRAARACAVATPAAEAALVVIVAKLVTGSLLAGLALGAATLALVIISHATRGRDAEIEARAAAHASARRRLDATKQAVRDAMTTLRVAHAADLARVAGEMGQLPLPPLQGGVSTLSTPLLPAASARAEERN